MRSEVKGELYGESIMEEGGQGMLKEKQALYVLQVTFLNLL